MIPARPRLLMGSFILWILLLAASHSQISAKPPGSFAQDNAPSQEPRLVTNEIPEPEKKSVSIEVVVKPMSSSGQEDHGGSEEKQRTGETAGFKGENAETVDPAPPEIVTASPLPGEKPTKMPEYEEEDEDDEDDDDDDDEAEEHEAEEADDDYDAAENAEEADDDDGGDGGGGDGEGM